MDNFGELKNSMYNLFECNLYLDLYLKDLLNNRFFCNELTDEDLDFLQFIYKSIDKNINYRQKIIDGILTLVNESEGSLTFGEVFLSLHIFEDEFEYFKVIIEDEEKLEQFSKKYENIPMSTYKLDIDDHLVYNLLSKINQGERTQLQNNIFNILDKIISFYKPKKSIGVIIKSVLKCIEKVIFVSGKHVC